MNNLTIAKTYQVKKKLGAGAFGEIFLVLNTKTNQEFAVKCQLAKAKTPQVQYESKLLTYLNSQDPTTDKGIPRVYYSGIEGEYNVMIMDLLGPSLEDLFNQYNRKFDLKTCMLLAYQMLQRIEFVHNKSFLHRDIKPDNFLVGLAKNCSKVYLIDFGLAKKYITKDNSHIPYKDNKNLTGTARYASLNTHLGIEQGRRDDLQGLANVLVYMMKGTLPWQNLKANNKKERYEKIMEKKLTIPIEVLCKGIPDEMIDFITYTRSIQFEDKPDYDMLKGLLKKVMVRENIEQDGMFGWNDSLSKLKML